MLVVQALYWAQASLRDLNERTRIENILRGLFADPMQGQLLRSDLRDGLSALPIWMQEFLRELLCIDRKGNVVGAPNPTDSQADPTPLSGHHGG